MIWMSPPEQIRQRYALVSFSGTVEQLLHASSHLLGAVDSKGEVGDVADAHAITELGANVTAGGHESFER